MLHWGYDEHNGEGESSLVALWGIGAGREGLLGGRRSRESRGAEKGWVALRPVQVAGWGACDRWRSSSHKADDRLRRSILQCGGTAWKAFLFRVEQACSFGALPPHVQRSAVAVS